MKTKAVVVLLALVTGLFVYGCGDGSANNGTGKTAAPKTPGDPAALIGTTWTETDTNAKFTFKDATNVTVWNPMLQQSLPGQYTLEDGIITIESSLPTRDGTWDGTDLTLRGKKLTKQ